MPRLVMAAALAVIFVVAAPVALANGDPASDVLLYDDVFFPYRVKPPRARAAELRDVVARANARGYTVKAALIGDRNDLGTVGVLWRKPQVYAKFLSQELLGPSPYKDRVLVVMPNGYGLSRNGTPLPAERRALDAVPSAEARREDLATASIRAIRRLAALQGVTLKGSPDGGGHGTVLWLVAAGITVVAVGAALGLARRFRRRDA